MVSFSFLIIFTGFVAFTLADHPHLCGKCRNMTCIRDYYIQVLSKYIHRAIEEHCEKNHPFNKPLPISIGNETVNYTDKLIHTCLHTNCTEAGVLLATYDISRQIPCGRIRSIYRVCDCFQSCVNTNVYKCTNLNKTTCGHLYALRVLWSIFTSWSNFPNN